MKRYLSGLLAGFVVLGMLQGLTACSAPENTEDSFPAATSSPDTKTPDSPYGSPVDFDRNGLSAAFADAIEAYCQTGRFPDGDEPLEVPSGRIDYAVFDVDGDGREELFLKYEQTAMAYMVELIYDYDAESQTFRQQFAEFPALTFYDNGVILAGWSHNQGLSGEKLWPYTLYQYQPDTDSYACVASVDGWSREVAEHSSDWGDFPADIDADENGFVYFILTDNWSWSNYGQTVDDAEYQAWISPYLQDANELEIPYQSLEIETIFPNAAG